MTKTTWYNITAAEGESSAEVSIYDTIGGHEINAKQFVSELSEIKADTIHLRINSPGGSVIDGNAIFNALQRHDAKVVTHIDGLAASMASVIAMAGDEVHMADNALLMIHNPWTLSIGDAEELRADADLLDKMTSSILSAYGRSQYEAEEIHDLMAAETWFTAQEALDAGLVDNISTGLRAAAADITKLAASSDISVPAEKQVASLTKQIEAMTKAADAVTDEIVAQAEVVDELTVKLATAEANIKSIEVINAEIDEAAEKATTELDEAKAQLEAKDAEIEEAKEVTVEAVAAKAAELVQAVTVAPVADTGDDNTHQLSSDEFWAEYKRVGEEHGLNAKNEWYAENKHRKI